MKHRFLLLPILLAVCSVSAWPQAWSAFLDPSRAVDWTQAGFTIPHYTVNCAVQPTLTANSATAAAANTTAIQNALASCNATHNVVNIPAGTYYVAGWTYGSQGHQVVRGAGPMSTYIYLTAEVACTGIHQAICMVGAVQRFNGSADSLPPDGHAQCLWTAGYTKGTTTITLSSCGGTPPVNNTIILDQANETSDTGGVFICDYSMANCTVQSSERDGRTIAGVTHSQQQVTYVTGVTSLGGGSYSVTISPGVYFNNIRSSQSPGAWWPGFVQNDGLENLTIDGTSDPGGSLVMFNCYQCWVRNVRSLYAGRDHILIMQSAQDVIRDSYFYGSQTHGPESYGIVSTESSGFLVENNILQQLTAPIIFGQGSGYVIGYNYSIDNIYTPAPTWLQTSYAGHSGGDGMGLWEGNDLFGIRTDDLHGTTATITLFRNMLRGWESGTTHANFTLGIRANHRGYNAVGNVMGQPGYHNTYESYAISSTGGVDASTANTSIYELGWTDDGGIGVCTSAPKCDPLVRSTLMRWGNYDTVTGGVRWNSTEASPAAVPYLNANFTTSYFDSLAHTLPASLYYSAEPSWWPSGKPWPPIGPDVTSGNLGICSGGIYAGAQATASSQCTGGSFTSAWAGHANSIPAQDCYLDVMQGPPDGSGNALSFDARKCYGPGAPTNVAATVH
jgi:hypothetical protein